MTSVFGESGITRAQAAALLHPGYPAGRFAIMGRRHQNLSLNTSDVLRLYLFQIFAPITVTSIWMATNTGGAGSAVKCAVWANNRATGQPTGLPLFGQNAGFDTTGAGVDQAAIASYPLAPGVYWAGEVHTGTAPVMVSVAFSDVSYIDMMMTAPQSFVNAWAVNQTYTNDIMATDLTSGAGLAVTNATVGAIGLGWA